MADELERAMALAAGWVEKPHPHKPGKFYWVSPDGGGIKLPPYRADDDLALRWAEEWVNRNRHCRWYVLTRLRFKGYWFQFLHMRRPSAHAEGKTRAEAICGAALKLPEIRKLVEKQSAIRS